MKCQDYASASCNTSLTFARWGESVPYVCDGSGRSTTCNGGWLDQANAVVRPPISSVIEYPDSGRLLQIPPLDFVLRGDIQVFSPCIVQEGEWDHLSRLKHKAEDLMRTIYLRGCKNGEEAAWCDIKTKDAAALVLTLYWHASLRYFTIRIDSQEAIQLWSEYAEQNTQKRRDDKVRRDTKMDARYAKENSVEMTSATELPTPGASTLRMNAMIRHAKRQTDIEYDLDIFGRQWTRLRLSETEMRGADDTEASEDTPAAISEEDLDLEMHPSLAVFDTFQAYEDLRVELCARRFERAFIAEKALMAEAAHETRHKSVEDIMEQYRGENTYRLKELEWKMKQDFPPVVELIQWRFAFERNELEI